MDRDYPALDDLERIHKALARRSGSVARDEPQSALRMDAEIFEKALEKLYIHGAVNVTYDDQISLSPDANGWRRTYRSQADYRRQQLELITPLSQGPRCRLVS